MNSRSRVLCRTAPVLVAVAAAAVGGCGDSGEQRSREERKSATKTTRVKLIAEARDDFRFDRKRLRAPAGRLKIDLDNRDDAPHNVRIATGEKCCFVDGARDIGGTTTAGPGDRTSARVDVKPGRYVFYCAIAGHWNGDAGHMRGVLVVD